MEWLFILGLGGWVWLQSQRIGTLTRKLAELERRFGDPLNAPPPTAAAAPAPPVDDREPLLLDTPLPPEALEPLLLDTPLPVASNDMDEPPPAHTAAPEALATAPPPTPITPSPPPPAPPQRERKFEQWLAENGLAWLGGGAFALGAIYLVAVATQQDWFTPVVQLGCAVALGLALLGASEWARFGARRRPPGHPLVAAMLAGAGVVTFYAAAWAAHGLYGMIGVGGAATLLALCALLLIGLSLLHGQAIGVLAIAAALLAPALTNAPIWPGSALTLFICGVSAAGLVLGALRRWPWVAAATIAGLYLWFAYALAANELPRALALLSFASLGGVAIAFRPPLTEETPAAFSWRAAHASLPAVAICISSVLLIWTWLASSPSATGAVAGPAWVGAMFVALAAAAVRARVAIAPTFSIAVGALAIGFIAYLRARAFVPVGSDFYPFVLFSALVIAISALGARPHHSDRALVATSGAVGAALLTVLAAFSRPDWHSPQAWAPLFAAAVLLGAAAWYTARSGADPRADSSVDVWAGVGAALLLLGIESAIPAEARTAAHAAASLVFAAGLAWRGWRVLRLAALSAATLAVAHALSPNLIEPVMSGAIPLWGGLTVLVVTAALLFVAGHFAASAAHASAGEALGAAGVMILLIAAFLALSWIATGGATTPRLDPLTLESLRALTLLAAGHIVMARPGQQLGRIGRWRGHVLLGLGLLYLLMIAVLMQNPWWGLAPARVAGPPLLDTLLLAFAAPAAIAGAAAYRLYDHQRTLARIYAMSGAALGLLWALLETRRLFHGPLLDKGAVGVLEAACYALMALAAALAVAIAARLRAARNPERPFTQDLLASMRATAWGGLVIAAFVMLMVRHPWWGSQAPTSSTTLAAGLAVAAQALAALLSLALGRALSISRPVEATRFATAAAAMLFAWSFGHAAIRWLYHGGAMDDGAPLTDLEGVAHALWPLAFILAASAAIVRAPDRDTTRQYLHDLQALCAVAVWPALGFAALGLWLLFNPWWGLTPAHGATAFTATLAPATPILAAWLSRLAVRVPRVRGAPWFARASLIACIGHLFVAATLIVRWLYHREVMSAAALGDIEMWTYSAVWALFGAGVFGLGLHRGDALLRWAGLAILLATTAKVFLLDTAQLSGVIRAVSAIGLAAVLSLVAWIARTYRPPPPAPGDLLLIKPSARRERRHGRRQRSS